MRKIAATYIFPANQAPVKNGILVCDNNGRVVDLIDNDGNFREEAGVEYYSGILVPGFVNAHCHLELSHLKGKIEEHTGIGKFIGKINTLRNHDAKEIEKAIQLADKKMWAAGIAAVGDISNSVDSIPIKRKSKIHYHTFVESFGFHPSRAEKSFAIANSVLKEYKAHKLLASIVPHSPYSVSEALFRKIAEIAEENGSILSIHNQESKGEAEFYKNGTGAIAQHLTENLGIDISHWKPGRASSLGAILHYLPSKNKLLLVHNTFTTKADIEELKAHRSKENTYLVVCPNSNRYIENCLPPINLFKKEGLNICLGTDSLASNHQLSILQEMIMLQNAFPELELHELVNWATVNGAKALGMENAFGTFEKGKTPGVNLITGVDFKQMKLSEKSKVKRLL